MSRLLLFDIDGTLVKVEREISRSTFVDAMGSVLDLRPDYMVPDGYHFHGRTDRSIFLDLAEFEGYDRVAAEELLPEFEKILIAGWRRSLNRDNVELCNGAIALLARLAEQSTPQHTLALLTGNIEHGARAKLEPHGLNDYFQFGAFGSDGIERDELPPFALQRARELNGTTYSFDETIIIGDSERDVSCAKAWGIRSIGVATGGLSFDELRACNPDLTVSSLLEMESILSFINN